MAKADIRPSNFREAAKLHPADVRCPHCDAVDLPPPAKATIEIDLHGRATCDACGHVWNQPKKEK